MNAKKFSDAMSELDTKYVDEALNYKKKAKKPGWVKWGAMAACFAVIADLGVGVFQSGLFGNKTDIATLDNGNEIIFVKSETAGSSIADNIHLEVFICPLSVAVYIQIQALAAIAQRLHPKTNWLFDFCMILNSCHRDSFLIFSTANIRISIEFEKQMRNKIAPNKSQSTESTENNRK